MQGLEQISQDLSLADTLHLLENITRNHKHMKRLDEIYNWLGKIIPA
jgi:ABC-type sugar transport system ATPase subunit